MAKILRLYSSGKAPDVFIIPSKKIIQTLLNCLKLESLHPRKPYGQADVNGSFISLYKRGLIDVTSYKDESKPLSWYITAKGFQFLLSVAPERIDFKGELYDGTNKFKK